MWNHGKFVATRSRLPAFTSRGVHTIQKVPLEQEIKRIEKSLYIKEPEDWYDVPKTHIKFTAKAASLLNQYPTVESLVRAAYPAHAWDPAQFATHRTQSNAPQVFLRRIVRSVFPDARIESNARSSHGVLSEFGKPLEIDVYLPDLQLGFEYQDPHHYFFTTYGIGAVTEYKSRDQLKRERVAQKGITLIIVPFWWDWDRSSLLASINAARPKLLSEELKKEVSLPISLDPPQHILEKYTYDIPGLGVPMMAGHPPTNKTFSPENWLLFEKYDGVRGIWHGKERQFYSRWGKILPIPNYICDTICNNTWLDAPHLISWNLFQYVVFDQINPDMRRNVYINRYKHLQQIMPSDHPFVQLTPYEVCKDRDHVETMGGEGIIMRDPYASYMTGYTQVFYKHKGFNDAEALILSKTSENPPRFLCRIKKAHLTHNLGDSPKADNNEDKDTDTEEREKEKEEDGGHYDIEMSVDEQVFDGDVSEIKEGSFVSFKYMGVGGSVGPPLSPKTLRNDITDWNQILHQKRKPPSEPKVWNPNTLNRWTPENKRKFMEKFAKEKDANPLDVKFWYSVTRSDVIDAGGKSIMESYSSFSESLKDIFPELDFEDHNFIFVSRNYWNKNSVKKYLESIAKEKGFDPLIPDNWYTKVSYKDFAKKGGFRNTNTSYVDAIMESFPNIGLEKIKFSRFRAQDHWKDVNNIRAFLDDFASQKKFNPNIDKNWYSIDVSKISSVKGASSLLKEHPVIIDAIVLAYPELNLIKHKFKSAPRGYWSDKENRRKVLEEVAQKLGFKYDQPEKWYTIRSSDINRVKGGASVLGGFYKSKLPEAIMDLFPEIGLERSKFTERKVINKQQETKM